MRLAAWRPSYEAFLAHPEPWVFLLPWARNASCLPIACDWTHAFGVTEPGDVVTFEHEPWPGSSGPPPGKLTEVRWLNVALHQGMSRYPWLKDLLPPRPSDAQNCSMCNAAAQLPPDFVCYCGGAGWVPASDSWVNKDRFVRCDRRATGETINGPREPNHG
jgi:hypothetical protein